MSDEIRPALTPNEWQDQEHRVERAGWWLYEPSGVGVVAGVGSQGVQLEDIRHATAALCLYQQPFGFTQEDADLVRSAAKHWEPSPLAARYASLASRLAALLPPSEERP